MKKTRLARKVWAVTMPKADGLWLALGVFLMTATLGVVVNSFVFGHGLRLDWSISRYVGSETWSAVVFALGNFFVAAMARRYLWRLGRAWNMPRVYYYCAFLMCVGLVLLSVFPTGYFDGETGRSLISFLHEISSRTMFIAMMLMAALLVGSWQASASTRAFAAAYLVYAVFCVTGYLTEGSWFSPLMLIYEAMYIVAFFLLLIVCRGSGERR